MFTIRAMKKEDLPAIKRFTDREIGQNYYSLEELSDVYLRSQSRGVMCSLVLEDEDGDITGMRLTYPPGQWEHGKGKGLHPERWPHAQDETAYFQSLFLAAKLQGQGWGGELSQKALEILREIGAKGVVCHSWKESPNNSSTRYLLKLGFESVAEHPLYWADIDYNCTRCLKPPCQCTAQEMYLDLERT
jgi:predicted N-acetyltransferase YhbS